MTRVGQHLRGFNLLPFYTLGIIEQGGLDFPVFISQIRWRHMVLPYKSLVYLYSYTAELEVL